MAAGVKHVINVTCQMFDIILYSHFAFNKFIISSYDKKLTATCFLVFIPKWL